MDKLTKTDAIKKSEELFLKEKEQILSNDKNFIKEIIPLFFETESTLESALADGIAYKIINNSIYIWHRPSYKNWEGHYYKIKSFYFEKPYYVIVFILYKNDYID